MICRDEQFRINIEQNQDLSSVDPQGSFPTWFVLRITTLITERACLSNKVPGIFVTNRWLYAWNSFFRWHLQSGTHYSNNSKPNCSRVRNMSTTLYCRRLCQQSLSHSKPSYALCELEINIEYPTDRKKKLIKGPCIETSNPVVLSRRIHYHFQRSVSRALDKKISSVNHVHSGIWSQT